mgnify:CR=1 FL=1
MLSVLEIELSTRRVIFKEVEGELTTARGVRKHTVDLQSQAIIRNIYSFSPVPQILGEDELHTRTEPPPALGIIPGPYNPETPPLTITAPLLTQQASEL